jgi:uncharacterized protein with PIN domain
MKTLSERLCFSATKEKETAVKIKKWHNANHYEILSMLCDDNDIDLSDVSDSDFEACVKLMEDHGKHDKGTDHYYFWLS